MSHEIRITDPSAIRQLAREVNFWGSPGKSLRVELSGYSAQQNEALQQEILRHYAVCGCDQGRTAGIVILLLFALLLLTGLLSHIGFWNLLWLYLGSSFVTMLLAKAYTIWRARRSLIRLSQRHSSFSVTP